MTIGIAIDAHIEGLAGVGDAFSRMVRLGYRPRPIWDAIGQYGESSTRLRFKNQKDPEGTQGQHRDPHEVAAKPTGLQRRPARRADGH